MMLNKTLPYLIAVTVGIVIFIAGFFTGTHFFASMKNATMLQETFFNSVPVNITLTQLDKEEVDKARATLLLYQDTSILTINSLAGDSDKESYKTACNMLKRIGNHRKDNPSKYTNYAYDLDEKKMANVQKEVGIILDKWQTTACDKSM